MTVDLQKHCGLKVAGTWKHFLIFHSRNAAVVYILFKEGLRLFQYCEFDSVEAVEVSAMDGSLCLLLQSSTQLVFIPFHAKRSVWLFPNGSGGYALIDESLEELEEFAKSTMPAPEASLNSSVNSGHHIHAHSVNSPVELLMPNAASQMNRRKSSLSSIPRSSSTSNLTAVNALFREHETVIVAGQDKDKFELTRVLNLNIPDVGPFKLLGYTERYIVLLSTQGIKKVIVYKLIDKDGTESLELFYEVPLTQDSDKVVARISKDGSYIVFYQSSDVILLDTKTKRVSTLKHHNNIRNVSFIANSSCICVVLTTGIAWLYSQVVSGVNTQSSEWYVNGLLDANEWVYFASPSDDHDLSIGGVSKESSLEELVMSLTKETEKKEHLSDFMFFDSSNSNNECIALQVLPNSSVLFWSITFDDQDKTLSRTQPQLVAVGYQKNLTKDVENRLVHSVGRKEYITLVDVENVACVVVENSDSIGVFQVDMEAFGVQSGKLGEIKELTSVKLFEELQFETSIDDAGLLLFDGKQLELVTGDDKEVTNWIRQGSIKCDAYFKTKDRLFCIVDKTINVYNKHFDLLDSFDAKFETGTILGVHCSDSEESYDCLVLYELEGNLRIGNETIAPKSQEHGKLIKSLSFDEILVLVYENALVFYSAKKKLFSQLNIGRRISDAICNELYLIVHTNTQVFAVFVNPFNLNSTYRSILACSKKPRVMFHPLLKDLVIIIEEDVLKFVSITTSNLIYEIQCEYLKFVTDAKIYDNNHMAIIYHNTLMEKLMIPRCFEASDLIERPPYHPENILELFLWGKTSRVLNIMMCLVDCVLSGKDFELIEKTAETEYSLKQHKDEIIDYLTSTKMPKLNNVEQLQLFKIVEFCIEFYDHIFNESPEYNLNLKRYLVSLFFYRTEIAFIFPLFIKEHALLDSIIFSSQEISFEKFKKYGICFWGAKTDVKKYAESMAKCEYIQNKSPESTAGIIYLALKKYKLWGVMWKSPLGGSNLTSSSTMQEQEKMIKYMAEFNPDDTNKLLSAKKNAYALLGKHRFVLAICFFLLARSISDAVNICVTKLGDVQLALLICRLCDEDDLYKATLERKQEETTGFEKLLFSCVLQRKSNAISSILLDLNDYSHETRTDYSLLLSLYHSYFEFVNEKPKTLTTEAFRRQDFDTELVSTCLEGILNSGGDLELLISVKNIFKDNSQWEEVQKSRSTRSEDKYDFLFDSVDVTSNTEVNGINIVVVRDEVFLEYLDDFGRRTLYAVSKNSFLRQSFRKDKVQNEVDHELEPVLHNEFTEWQMQFPSGIISSSVAAGMVPKNSLTFLISSNEFIKDYALVLFLQKGNYSDILNLLLEMVKQRSKSSTEDSDISRLLKGDEIAVDQVEIEHEKTGSVIIDSFLDYIIVEFFVLLKNGDEKIDSNNPYNYKLAALVRDLEVRWKRAYETVVDNDAFKGYKGNFVNLIDSLDKKRLFKLVTQSVFKDNYTQYFDAISNGRHVRRASGFFQMQKEGTVTHSSTIHLQTEFSSRLVKKLSQFATTSKDKGIFDV